MSLQSSIEQKLVCFYSNVDDEMYKVTQEIKKGWSILSLIQNGNYNVAIMERINYDNIKDSEKMIYFPKVKKICIHKQVS